MYSILLSEWLVAAGLLILTVELVQEWVEVFEFLKFDSFKVFNDHALGKIFFPKGLNYYENLSTYVSIKHGRSCAIKVSDFEWILVKGGGWNYGGCLVYRSTKDKELSFGLFGKTDAIREYEVSKKIEEIANEFPQVLYYKIFSDYKLPSQYDFLKTIKYNDLKPVEPCLLYTKVKSPFRIADLQFYSDSIKNEIIRISCEYWNIGINDYLEYFCKKLANHVSLMHKNGFINDSLEYSNITMLAEIVDYEWITAPNIPLPDGNSGNVFTYERKEKEILYAVEAILFLSALIHIKYDFFDIYETFISEYKKTNSDYVDLNINIWKILKRERFIF